MIHCPRCQSELPQDARFCNRCGFNQTNAKMVSVSERVAQQASPATPGMPSPQVPAPPTPAQQFAMGNLPTTPMPGKEAQKGLYDTVAAPPDTPPARRLSLRERYLAEQALGTQTKVPSQPLAPTVQPAQPAASPDGQGRTRLSHFVSQAGGSSANNAPATQRPQPQPANNDDQGWIEPEQRYRQNQVIRTSTPRPPVPNRQPQPIVRTSTPPVGSGPGAPMGQPRAMQPPPQPQPRSYSLDGLFQQDAILSEASRYALQRWRQGWWQRQHDEAAPAVGVSRGQAHVPEPLMRMQHSIARMRAIIVPKRK